MSKKIQVEESSGNVFAEIGLPNSEQRLPKAEPRDSFSYGNSRATAH